MAATPSDAELVRETIARLEQITADLDGYAERKARLIADVWIAQGFEAAAADTAEARGEAQRWRDCNTELGRMLEARDRQIARWREIAEGKASDLILRCDEVRPGDRILDDGCQDMTTILRVDTYDDHLGISVTESGVPGRRWYLDRQPDALTAVRRATPGAGDTA